jgi:hypothetical protein
VTTAGKVQQSRELLAPVYGWFTEGFDTRDLMEAKALLDQLVAQRFVIRPRAEHFPGRRLSLEQNANIPATCWPRANAEAPLNHDPSA